MFNPILNIIENHSISMNGIHVIHANRRVRCSHHLNFSKWGPNGDLILSEMGTKWGPSATEMGTKWGLSPHLVP